ncbi:MAG: hypothetical protein WDN69_06795 [Aliidongia sp.]
MLLCAPIENGASAGSKRFVIKINFSLIGGGRVMTEDVCYEIQVRKNGNWVPLGLVATPRQAEQDARAALGERKYLEAYKIVCERRDGRSGKINKIAFAPVLRENLDGDADQQWERHLQGKLAVDPPAKKKGAGRRYSWLLPILFLLLIMWGAYFALVFLRTQFFGR